VEHLELPGFECQSDWIVDQGSITGIGAAPVRKRSAFDE